MSDIIKDLPLGPLDFYRKKASFDWKKLKLFIHTPDIVQYEVRFQSFSNLLNFLKYRPND